MRAKENNIARDYHLSLIPDPESNHSNHLCFKKSPSSLWTLWQAFIRGQKHTFKPGQALPGIELSGTGIHIDSKHLSAFNRICGERNSSHISPLYPFAVVYPYILRLLSHKALPLSIFRSLNTRNQLVMYRTLEENDAYDVHVRLSDYRVVEKGIEVDVTSIIYKAHQPVWDNVFTYYYRGKYGRADDSFTPPRLDPIRNGLVSDPFYVEAKNGFRFARHTGDTNGIHYNSLYARMLGFKGAFAQPLRTVSKCLQKMQHNHFKMPIHLKLFYKGPVYYNQWLTLMHAHRDKSFRFDLFCDGNEKPCICGHFWEEVI